MLALYNKVIRCFMLLSFIISPSWASDQSDVESQELYAAYVYNFMLFARWPEETVKTERTLCIAGENRNSIGLKKLTGKTINNTEQITTQYIANEDEIDRCHVLFIASPEYSYFLDLTLDRPILTIGNITLDNGRSVALNLLRKEKKLTFELDFELLKRSKVHLPSSVLRLANKSKA